MRIYSKIAKCMDENCSFKVFREVCGRLLSEKDIQVLLSTGKTPMLKGLVGKSGKKFNASVVLKSDGTTSFEFNNKR